MHRLTKRLQRVEVATLATLRERLQTIRDGDWRFTIDKVQEDRVTVRADRLAFGKTMRCSVVLPSYPTGHQDDIPGNPNVVLDPLEFVNAETCKQRQVFAPLLGRDVLDYYDKLHQDTGPALARCC